MDGEFQKNWLMSAISGRWSSQLLGRAFGLSDQTSQRKSYQAAGRVLETAFHVYFMGWGEIILCGSPTLSDWSLICFPYYVALNISAASHGPSVHNKSQALRLRVVRFISIKMSKDVRR